jgi:hypothetical protein
MTCNSLYIVFISGQSLLRSYIIYSEGIALLFLSSKCGDILSDRPGEAWSSATVDTH